MDVKGKDNWQLIKSHGPGDDQSILEENSVSTNLTIGIATSPVIAGNQLNICLENSPGSNVAGLHFEQHFHYEQNSEAAAKEEQRCEEDETVLLDEIALALKKHYSSKAAWFVPFEWMREQKLPPEEYYVDLDIVKLSRSNRFIKQEAVPMEKILVADSESNLEPHNVLVHGEPGIGKTTVCIQLIYDWATRKDSPFAAYPLVIFVPFRALDMDVDDFIVDLCCKATRETPPSKEVVKKILKRLGSKLLLVLDSLEELPHNVEDSFFKLLTFDRSRQQSLLYQATIIVTTRSNPPMEYIEVFNRHVRINGFSFRHQGEYVEKYFKHEPEKLGLMKRELDIGTYRGLGACPLMLYILCYLHDLGEVILKSTRATDIYSTVTSLLITRSANRESGRPDMVLESRDLEHFLIQLGHLCCNCMRDGRLYVTEGEILLVFASPVEQKIVKGSGLIKLANYPQKIKKDYFEPSHRSFFEFLAAKSFKYELSKAMNQEKRFSLVQSNNRLLTETNSPVLIYMCGLDVGHSGNELLSLEYFQQNEQKVTTNDPILNLKTVDVDRSAFSVVTSSLLINEITSPDKLQSVLELTKHYDQTPNFTTCPPFFYQGFTKFLGNNLKPITKLSYDLGCGDYTMELNALKFAPKIEKLLLNFVIPYEKKQLGERDLSPFTFLRGVLKLDNMNYMSVKVNEFWTKVFVEEVDDSFKLQNLKYLDFQGHFSLDDFIQIKNWIEIHNPLFSFLSCDVFLIHCKVDEIFQNLLDVVFQVSTEDITVFKDGINLRLRKNEGDGSLTWTKSYREEDGVEDQRVLVTEQVKSELYSTLGFDDPNRETGLQVHLIHKFKMKWEFSFWSGAQASERQNIDRFVSCYRTIQLGDRNLEWRGDIPVISQSDKGLTKWYEITHDMSSNVSTW